MSRKMDPIKAQEFLERVIDRATLSLDQAREAKQVSPEAMALVAIADQLAVGNAFALVSLDLKASP